MLVAARTSWISLGVLALLPFLPGLGSLGAGTHPDEATYFGISLEMHSEDAWWTPTLDGEPKWYKPPLMYWAQRVAYSLFGATVFAGRLPIALCAVVLVFLVRQLARRMYGERSATFALLACASAFGVAKFGRLGMMDVPLALAMAWAAYGVWRAAVQGVTAAVLHVGTAAGFSMWLKGPVGMLIIALFAGTFVAIRAPALFRTRWFALALLLGALVGLPWFLVSYWTHGEPFVRFFFLGENLGKFRHPWRVGDALMLVVALVLFSMPWSFLSFGGAARWARSVISAGRSGAPSGDHASLLCVLWIAAVLFLFVLPSVKFVHYVVPAIPAMILLAAGCETPAWATVGTRWGLAVLGVGLVGVALALARLGFSLVALAAAAGAGALLVGASVAFPRFPSRAAGAACGALAICFGLVLPAVAPPALPPAVSAVVAKPLFTFNTAAGPIWMAGGRPVRRLWSAEEVRRALKDGIVVLAVADLATLPELGDIRELSRWKRWRSRISPGDLWAAWHRADRSMLEHDMVAIAAAD